jgi:hypothetical protein
MSKYQVHEFVHKFYTARACQALDARSWPHYVNTIVMSHHVAALPSISCVVLVIFVAIIWSFCFKLCTMVPHKEIFLYCLSTEVGTIHMVESSACTCVISFQFWNFLIRLYINSLVSLF